MGKEGGIEGREGGGEGKDGGMEEGRDRGGSGVGGRPPGPAVTKAGTRGFYSRPSQGAPGTAAPPGVQERLRGNPPPPTGMGTCDTGQSPRHSSGPQLQLPRG